ncbi:MAG: dicarboxylate/amino acid:cation symporter [Gloeocapsa sp. DLM2.Bin57]|nr:MAG: dicarboxylate/amino acid:cation symporter [Gloeocapsa sp. DLM2.Bin57]
MKTEIPTPKPTKKRKKIGLANRILLAMLLGVVFGIVCNLFLPESFNLALNKWLLNPIGTIFLRAIRMVVVPLVLFSLIGGTASIGDIRKLGRVGIKTIAYFMLTTAFSITLALLFTNLLQPGAGATPMETAQEIAASEAPFIMDMLVAIVPNNPFEALVTGDMLQIIFFAMFFGIAITLIGQRTRGIVELFEQLNEVFLKIIMLVMNLAPYAVFALLASVIMVQGIDVLRQLTKYLVLVIFLLLIEAFIVNGVALAVLGKVNPITFYKKYWPVMLVGFGTSSSNATIPANLDACVNKLGVPSSIGSFTIPLGATINMNGTSIMQGVAALFIAQVYGIELGLSQQLTIILTATLASIGTAGVPSAGIVMLTMVLQQVGLPIEGAALVLSVDRIVDMFRTSANITGDAVASVVVAKSENELNQDMYNQI